MKIADNIINKYGSDKIIHFFGGGWIVSMFTLLGWLGVILGVIIMLILSFVKELFLDDFFDKGDIIASCLGSAISSIVYLILTLLI